ncbi:hypothetical protein [Caulobacter sp. X]|uniref:hypothetical protein n=1 Tax=Caulobacter sp. X TaxID=2048901 RepID=UPI000C144E22|nr:hypothetical protein [Caulobacter sp. X]PIB95222.1 hypothetical protein CSW60_21950 [Caulobacter sp. X]
MLSGTELLRNGHFLKANTLFAALTRPQMFAGVTSFFVAPIRNYAFFEQAVLKCEIGHAVQSSLAYEFS